jgi:hypothetical protein
MTLQDKHIAHLSFLWHSSPGWRDYVKARIVELERDYPTIRAAFKAEVKYETPHLSVSRLER